MVAEEEISEGLEPQTIDLRTQIESKRSVRDDNRRASRVKVIGQGLPEGREHPLDGLRIEVLMYANKEGYLSHPLISPRRKGTNKYCRYHEDHGHDTECIYLKNDI